MNEQVNTLLDQVSSSLVTFFSNAEDGIVLSKRDKVTLEALIDATGRENWEMGEFRHFIFHNDL